MRYGEKHKNINYDKTVELSKKLAECTGLKSYLFVHIIYLNYFGQIHEIACKARDSENNRLNEVSIEITGIGCLVLDVSNNDMKFKELRFEDEFKTDIINAVSKGDTPLYKHIKERFSELIKKKYEDIIKMN